MNTFKYHLILMLLIFCVHFRIQQIQLLGRDMKGAEHDKLWNQLEAEIHLHRHKTVIRACRGRAHRKKRLPIPLGHVSTVQQYQQYNGWKREICIYICVCVCVCVISLYVIREPKCAYQMYLEKYLQFSIERFSSSVKFSISVF